MRAQLVERALELITKGRAGERFEQRPAEIQRAQFRQRQPRGEALERLPVDRPPRPSIVARSDRRRGETRLLRAPEVASDGARRDVAQRREIVDCDAGVTRALDLAQDRPLSNDFRIAWHTRLYLCAVEVDSHIDLYVSDRIGTHDSRLQPSVRLKHVFQNGRGGRRARGRRRLAGCNRGAQRARRPPAFPPAA